MSLKILFIYPPPSLTESVSELADVGNYQQPLGLAYLAAVLEKENYQIKIIDAPTLGYSFDKIVKEVEEFKPDLIGVSILTASFKSALELSEKLKKINKTPIVIGGPHVTALPEEVMRFFCFDFGIIGEGEMTILELVKALENHQSLDNVAGLVFRKDKEIIKTPIRPMIEDLDSLPFPARHLLPLLSAYRPTAAMYRKSPIGTIITSRGCPYKCVFCSRAIFGNSCRFRSVENVIQELEILVNDYKAKEIRIWDDTFNADPERAIKICEEIVKRKLNITWTCLARLNFARKDVLTAMKQAGCWQISYGIESGNDEILKKIKKGINTEMIRRGIKATKEAGISTLGFFIFGLPGETEETMRQTIDFAKELDLDAANFTVCTPFPATEIYDELKAKGLIKEIDYDKLMVNLPEKLYYIPEGLNEAIIKKYERMAIREFYLRPKYIFRQIWKISSLSDLWRKFKAYLTIKKIR